MNVQDIPIAAMTEAARKALDSCSSEFLRTVLLQAVARCAVADMKHDDVERVLMMAAGQCIAEYLVAKHKAVTP